MGYLRKWGNNGTITGEMFRNGSIKDLSRGMMT